MSEMQKYRTDKLQPVDTLVADGLFDLYQAYQVDSARAADQATIADLQAKCAELHERLARSEDHILWLLPMAKGWAAANPVGANQQICNDAQEYLAAADGKSEEIAQLRNDVALRDRCIAWCLENGAYSWDKKVAPLCVHGGNFESDPIEVPAEFAAIIGGAK